MCAPHGGQPHPRHRDLRQDGTPLYTQDPYCKVYLGGQFQRSQTCQSGGKNPNWTDRMFFTIPYGTDPIMKVEVMDNDAFEDDIIGFGSYNVGQYLSQGMNTTGNNRVMQSWSI